MQTSDASAYLHECARLHPELTRRLIDYVVSGEADETFPALVERLGCGAPIDDIAGIVYRRGRHSIATAAPHGVANEGSRPPAARCRNHVDSTGD
jgi:radical SAM superfamily enzyme YgiQ (UPF0313 family)